MTLSTTKKSLNFNSAVFAVTGRAEVQNRLGRKAQHNKGSGNSPTSYMTGKGRHSTRGPATLPHHT